MQAAVSVLSLTIVGHLSHPSPSPSTSISLWLELARYGQLSFPLRTPSSSTSELGFTAIASIRPTPGDPSCVQFPAPSYEKMKPFLSDAKNLPTLSKLMPLMRVL